MEWISVKDELPPEHGEIIVYAESNKQVWCTETYINIINGNILAWSKYPGIEVTHWMPLPESPIM